MALYKKICGVPVTLIDLESLDPTLYRSLTSILTYEEGTQDDFKTIFDLDFTITREQFGATEQIPLCENGSSRPVTIQNRHGTSTYLSKNTCNSTHTIPSIPVSHNNTLPSTVDLCKSAVGMDYLYLFLLIQAL